MTLFLTIAPSRLELFTYDWSNHVVLYHLYWSVGWYVETHLVNKMKLGRHKCGVQGSGVINAQNQPRTFSGNSVSTINSSFTVTVSVLGIWVPDSVPACKYKLQQRKCISAQIMRASFSILSWLSACSPQL